VAKRTIRNRIHPHLSSSSAAGSESAGETPDSTTTRRPSRGRLPHRSRAAAAVSQSDSAAVRIWTTGGFVRFVGVGLFHVNETLPKIAQWAESLSPD